MTGSPPDTASIKSQRGQKETIFLDAMIDSPPPAIAAAAKREVAAEDMASNSMIESPLPFVGKKSDSGKKGRSTHCIFNHGW